MSDLRAFFAPRAAAPAPPPAPTPAPPVTTATARAPKYGRAPGKKMCAHGIKCYRKNPAHFTDEDHPADHPFLVQAAAENPPSAAAPPPPAQPMQATASLPTKRAREEDEADDNTVVAGASPAKATTSAEVSAPSPSSGGGSSSSSSHHAEPIVTAPARPALTSSSALAPYAGGAHERAAWLSRLSSSFLTSFGDDTFDLVELAAKENASQPSAAFAAAGVSLLAPFRLLFGELREADCLTDRGLLTLPNSNRSCASIAAGAAVVVVDPAVPAVRQLAIGATSRPAPLCCLRRALPTLPGKVRV